MEIDFKEILITGICENYSLRYSNNNNFKDYLIRKYKESNKEKFYEANEFFKEIIDEANKLRPNIAKSYINLFSLSEYKYKGHIKQEQLDEVLETIKEAKNEIIMPNNYFADIENTFEKLSDEIFTILNSEPISVDTIKQDVGNYTINAKNYISKYYKIALNDALLMADLAKKAKRLILLIEFLIEGFLPSKDNNKSQKNLGEDGLSVLILLKDLCSFLKQLLKEINTENEKALPPKKSETDTEKYTAKHYLLAYLFECNAKGESYPIGNKKELERIGNERMGTGKGNRFYKVFNEVINKDLNAEKNLFEIGGEYWRKAVIELSKAPELVENYLQSKQL